MRKSYDMLVFLSEVLETPVSTLLGENLTETEADSLKAISEKHGDPETAVLGVAFHSFEWLFIRTAAIIFTGAVTGVFLTRKKG